MKIDYFKIGQFTDTKKYWVSRITDIQINESLELFCTSGVIIFECLTKKEAQQFIKNYKTRVGVK